MVIQLKDIVEKCYDNSDGQAVYEAIQKVWQQSLTANDKISLSFDGFDFITTSFLNASLVRLAEENSVETMKAHIAITNSNRAINDAIRDRFSATAVR